MTTEKKSENTPSDNKVIFGPLGKYAVIAVIMVSIIVTTAIMLEKQLNTIDTQVAELEAGLEESNKNRNSAEITASIDLETESASIETTPIEVAASSDSSVNTNTEATISTDTTNKTPTAESLVAQETDTQITTEQVIETSSIATKENNSKDMASDAKFETSTEMSTAAITEQKQAETQNTWEEERQARIESFKLEQKKHMTEIFSRIKNLESQQLDRYKTSQSNQVGSLRKQVAKQQQMIEALILRNKDLYELRAANVNRNQSNREQLLNRI